MKRFAAVAVGLVGVCIVVASITLATSSDLRPEPVIAASPAIQAPSTAALAARRVNVKKDEPARTVPYHAPLQRLSTDRDLFATYRELDRSTRGGDLTLRTRSCSPAI